LEAVGRYWEKRGGTGGTREVQELAGRYRGPQGGVGGSREL